MYTVNETMNSAVKNFRESVGLINIWLLKPDDNETRIALLMKLDTLEEKIEKDVCKLSQVAEENNTIPSLYIVYNAQNSLRNCLCNIKKGTSVNYLNDDFRWFKNDVDVLEVFSVRFLKNLYSKS